MVGNSRWMGRVNIEDVSIYVIDGIQLCVIMYVYLCIYVLMWACMKACVQVFVVWMDTRLVLVIKPDECQQIKH